MREKHDYIEKKLSSVLVVSKSASIPFQLLVINNSKSFTTNSFLMFFAVM